MKIGKAAFKTGNGRSENGRVSHVHYTAPHSTLIFGLILEDYNFYPQLV